MIGLFDRDVFYKLACCSLWELALPALSVSQPYRLSSTNSERSNERALRRLVGETDLAAAVARLAPLIATVPELGEELIAGLEVSAEFQRLGDIDDIDAGERVLAAIVLRKPAGRVLISGDKRFFSALQNELPEDWKAVEGSLISFEGCLLAIEQKFGFDILVERAHPMRHCDGSLRNAFGSTLNRDDFCAGLRSFDPLDNLHVRAATIFD